VPARIGRPPAWLRSPIVRLLVLPPVFAIPFALFFGILFGARTPGAFLRVWLVSAVFSYVIYLFSMLNSDVVLPRLVAPRLKDGKVPLPIEVLSFVGSALTASFVAALLIHFTIMPGFLGSARSVAIVGMFALVFSVLVTGLVYAWFFYQQSLDRARAEQELEMARRIQRSFLLSQFPTSPRVQVHAFNRSSREVSGDFYDVVPAGDGAFLIAVADVAGKGVPAALLTSMLQASLRTQARTLSPAAILTNMNALAHRSSATYQFATFFLARLDERTLELRYTNAGHNPPMLVRAGGAMETLSTGGTVVGILEQIEFDEGLVRLAPGDRLVVYSDGITEAEAPDGDMFGEERLAAVLRALPRDESAERAISDVLAALDRHLGGREAGDDVTLLVLRVLEQAAAPATV